VLTRNCNPCDAPLCTTTTPTPLHIFRPSSNHLPFVSLSKKSTSSLTTASAFQQSSTLSWASPAPPYLERGLCAKAPSPPDPTLKPSYSQIVKTKIPPRDLEKRARDPGKVTHDVSRDPSPVLAIRDLTHDHIRPRDPIRSCDPTCFGRATRPLIGTWKTVGINQRSTRSQGIPQGIPHRLSPMDTGTGNTLIGLRA